MKPRDKANAALAFIISHAESNRGTVAELTRRLNAKVSTTITRQDVEGWLHPKKDKRREPRLGVGLLLIETGMEVIKEKATHGQG